MRPVVIQELNPLSGLSIGGQPSEEQSLRALLHSHRAELIRLQHLMLEALERISAIEDALSDRRAR
jgi:hypothetical protein